MISVCETLIEKSIGSKTDCTPNIQGVKRMGVIINRSEATVETSGNNVTISATNTYAIYQPSNKPFNGTTTEAAIGKYLNSFTHTVQFVILKDDEDAAELIDQIANGSFIIVLDKVDGTKKVYGAHNGLKLSAASNAIYDDDSLGGWVVTLQEVGSPASALFTTSSVEPE